MFKRKIEEELVKWKNSLSTKKKAFVLKGLRQVGKTTIVREFAKKNYDNVIYINFKTSPSLKNAFAGDVNVDLIKMRLTAMMTNIAFVPGKTVLILDEIQECSAARASIKDFMEDGRFDVIASGSLLGIKGYNKKYAGGVPVGFERTVYMKAMDFEEFLWAKGIDESVLGGIANNFDSSSEIDETIRKQLESYYREYICVGGMPAVVDVFIKTGDMNEVYRTQKDLIEEYKDDFAKHLDENENEVTDKSLLTKINQVFDSIPSQLAKENKKFMISKINKKSNMETYSAAIQWLVEYGLIQKCQCLNLLERPLSGNTNDSIFKIYMCDTGLFMAMLGKDAFSSIVSGDMGIYKGAVYENAVAETLVKNGRDLFYYSKSSGLELDFVTTYCGKISLIEVKATNGNAKSLKTVTNDESNYPEVAGAFKLCDANISKRGKIVIAPHFAASFIKE